ncbi:MAG: DUF4124 domain-containing protein [Methylococcales bacterium]
MKKVNQIMLLSTLTLSSAHADIYKCVNDAGKVRFTNRQLETQTTYKDFQCTAEDLTGGFAEKMKAIDAAYAATADERAREAREEYRNHVRAVAQFLDDVTAERRR